MKNGKPFRGSKKRTPDQIMRNTAILMARDFQNTLNDPSRYSDFVFALQSGDSRNIRTCNPSIDYQFSGHVSEFKRDYQMASILKRWRFENDLHTDDELEKEAINKFLQVQDRIAGTLLPGRGIGAMVLEEAARLTAEMLGPYSAEEHYARGRFGKKASVGIPARKACEAERWELPISGSSQQISWFIPVMDEDPLVVRYLTEGSGAGYTAAFMAGHSVFQEVDELALALVPKTFKSLRAIMPNTTIGSYSSFGLGEMIRLRLKRAGYDIRTLQERHKSLARAGSARHHNVTLDLSSASDTISVELVERILPPDWFEVLNSQRIGNVRLPDGTLVASKTFATMGIGYTFPLQTLIFLNILRAIESVTFGRRDKRTISVYGDDMIFDQRMYEAVIDYFDWFGFVVNVDKTFHTGNFRESCGGDYYAGVDVRPFQPQKGQGNVSGKGYEAMLYKFLNGLLRRWSEHELPLTLKYLASEVTHIAGRVRLVPSDFSDDAGLKVDCLQGPEFLRGIPVVAPKSVGHGVYRFSYLRLVPEQGKEPRNDPYYWVALRGHTLVDDSRVAHPWSHGRDSGPPFVRLIDELTGISGATVPQLIWLEERVHTSRSCKTGKGHYPLVSYRTLNHSGKYERRVGLSTFESRR